MSPLSEVESYLALRLEIRQLALGRGPFYLRTGKRLARRVTEVVRRYGRCRTFPSPRAPPTPSSPNTMRLRIQPDEGIELSFAAKVPGSPFRVRTVPLSFTYGATFAERRPERTRGSSSTPSSATPRCSSAPTRWTRRGRSSSR